MNPNDQPSYARLEPLSEEMDVSLKDLDAQLHKLSRHSQTPSGLSNRIYDASVSLLPQPVTIETTTPKLRLVRPPRRFSMPVVTWSRLALAASVALAIGVGVWFTSQSTTPALTERLVLQPTVDPVVELTSQINQIPESSATLLENEFAYLFETSEMTSVDDVTGELAMLVARLD